jgi:response regulator RpfG family c-di-GMP phosphodiesterase
MQNLTSNRELLKASCEIAHEHHERWDGSGYPRGLAGEDISLFARITTLADVYDALMSDRCYKKAWSEEKTLDYIYNEKGRTFDPMLVTLFLANVDEARAIRQSLPNDTDEALHHHSAPRHE